MDVIKLALAGPAEMFYKASRHLTGWMAGPEGFIRPWIPLHTCKTSSLTRRGSKHYYPRSGPYISVLAPAGNCGVHAGAVQSKLCIVAVAREHEIGSRKAVFVCALLLPGQCMQFGADYIGLILVVARAVQVPVADFYRPRIH